MFRYFIVEPLQLFYADREADQNTGSDLMYKPLVITVLSLSLGPTATFASIDYNLPDLGEPYEREINFGRIRTEFSLGNYEFAVNLSLEKLYQEARQQFIDEKKLAINVVRLAEKLDEILYSSQTTDEEKGEEVSQLIARSLEPYEFTSSSSMSPSLKHSIEYGASFISWNDMTKRDDCSGFMAETIIRTVCDQYGFCHDEFQTIYTYKKAYLVQVPDYYIYRVVNGEQKLITQIKGHRQVSEKNYSLSSDSGWFDLVKNGYNYYQDIPEASIEEGRIFWFDLHSDVREAGETLSYKIVADNSNYKLGNCGHSNQWISTIDADSDGDGRMDFIPEHEYLKFFGEYYGWLVPAVSATTVY